MIIIRMLQIVSLIAAVELSSGCANTEYGGLNYATVIAPNGEAWKVISGKDQTDTRLDITRGDTAVHYSSSKEDATAALTTALKAQTDLISQLAGLVTGLAPKP